MPEREKVGAWMKELVSACLSLELTKDTVDWEVLQQVFLDESLGLHFWCPVGITRRGEGLGPWNFGHIVD
jgi:hypothetical protein